jgi:hypothetical protein
MKADKKRLIITVHREGTAHVWNVSHRTLPGTIATKVGSATSSADAWGAAFREASKLVGLVLP